MRLRTTLVAIVCGVASVAHVRGARATDCSGILSPCINDDTLWPHAGPAQFVAIGSTDTVGSGRLGFGLVTTYLSRPIVIHVPSPGGGGSDAYAVDNLLNGTFLWAYGVTDRLELDLALAVTYFHDGRGLSPPPRGHRPNRPPARRRRLGFADGILPPPRAA